MKMEYPCRADEARTITLALKGRWMGRSGLCRCPAHSDKEPSLSVSTGRGGALLLKCHAGCSFDDILAALRWQGLVDGEGRPAVVDYAAIARAEATEKVDAKRKERRALRIWKEARPITGTMAETYLRSRAITCALPESLRYHHSCRHPSGVKLPALVAAVDGAACFAIHRTYLLPDGSGKAEVLPQKAMLGTTAGGGIRLFTGLGPLVIGEGIESTLSAAQMMPGHGEVWAALSASGMAMFQLPNEPGELVIAIDADPAGRAAGRKLGERAVAFGWHVLWAEPSDGLDWNDVLRQQKGAV